MSAATALWPHVSDASWETVADLAIPGTGATIAKIRAGDGSTTQLPVTAAVRFLESLPVEQREAAARGDRRAAVISLEGVVPPPARVSDPVRTARRVFSGTGAEIAARLAKRAKVTTEIVDEFCAAPDDVVTTTMVQVLCLAAAEDAGRVVAEVSRRNLDGGVLRLLDGVEAARTAAPAAKSWVWHHKMFDGVAAALAALDVPAAQKVPRQLHVDRVEPWDATDAQLVDLVAAALRQRLAVRTTRRVATGALGHLDVKWLRSSGNSTATIITAAVSGVGWRAVAHAAPGGAKQPRLAVLCGLAASSAPAEFIDAAATSMFSDAPGDGWTSRSVIDAIQATSAHLDTAVGLNLLLDLPNHTDTAPSNADIVVAYLGGAYGHRCDPVAVESYLAGSHGTRAATALRACAARPTAAMSRTNLTAAQSLAPGLAPLWRVFLNHQFPGNPFGILGVEQTSTVFAGAVAVLAADIEAAVLAAGGGADLWAATFAMSENFDGPLDELVRCAAAVVAEP